MGIPAIPVLNPTPGAGSFDPSVVDQLALNDHLFLAEFDRYRAIINFLNAFRDWKENSLQQVGKGPLLPPPIPPPGYSLPVDPPAPPPPPPNFNPVIGERSAFGTYPAYNDANSAGTVVSNPNKPGATLTRVSQKTPFGNAEYWIDTP